MVHDVALYSNKKVVILIILLWLPSSLLILWAASYIDLLILSHEHYTDSFDLQFLLTTVVVIGGHAIAYLVGAVSVAKIMNKSSVSPAMGAFVIITGLIVMLVQIVLRNFSIGLSHSDCYDSCVDSVIPINKDYIIGYIDQAALASTFIIFVSFVIYIILASSKK